ncbi:MAG: SpoIIE family protein phosphatase [Anaerolineae bacterium]|nr:SpoIIE family protein phosphatase [Thermoflexales bacterium]MDW8408718.1 SpoIIE family protein phosphatase [Anaerolineae bacterium]
MIVEVPIEFIIGLSALILVAFVGLLGATGYVYLRRRASRRALEQRVAELQALSNAVNRIASASLDEEALCRLVYDCAAQLVDVNSFQLGLFEDDDYVIKVRYERGVLKPPARFHLGEAKGIVGWMRDTGNSLLVRDFQTEMDSLPARPRYTSDHPPRSAVFVPMVTAEAIIGAISIQSDTPNAYTESHLRTLSIVANQAASAIQNARALAREKARARQLELVAEVARQTATILTTDELLPRLTQAIRNTFGYYFVGLILLDEECGDLVFRSASHPAMIGVRLKMGQGLIGVSAQERRMIAVPDTSTDPRYLSMSALPQTRSEIAAPLMIEQRVIGVLDLQSERVAAFSADDQRYIEILASQVAVAVEDARLYEAEREQSWMSMALLQVAEVSRRAESLEDALTAVARLVPMLTGVDCCALLTYEAATNSFQISALHGSLSRDEHLVIGDTLLPADVPALEEMLMTRRPVMGTERGRLAAPVLAAPLIAQDQLLGAMLVGQKDGSSIRKRRRELLTGLANQAALVIDAVRANLAQQEESWVTAALLQVAQTVSEQADLNDIAGAVVRLTPLLVSVDMCAIFVREGNDVNLRAAQAYGLSPEAQEQFERDAFPVGAWREWFQSNEMPSDSPTRDERIQALRPAPAVVAERLGIKVCAALPLIAKGDPVGAMVIGVHDAGRLPAGRALNILNGIAQQTALAIDNARLYRESLERQRLEQELSLAREIQTSFLPKEAPRVAGWGLAADWQAARQVGGDFYDFVALPDGRYGLVIADVADKGVPAALFMALSRTLMRAVAFTGRTPAEALRRVNQFILSDARSDLFVTVFYAIWNPANGEVVYANAGHNPPVLARANGEIDLLPGRGVALGVIEEIELESHSVDIGPGDVLLLYTDGVTDALNETDEAFGMERLKQTLVSARHLSAGEIVKAIMSAVEQFACCEGAFDDETILVLKRDEP